MSAVMPLARSNQPTVRNPMLSIPEVRAFAALPPDSQQALIVFLAGCELAFRPRAEQAWRKHKAPMAAYWKQLAVLARHIRMAARAVAD